MGRDSQAPARLAPTPDSGPTLREPMAAGQGAHDVVLLLKSGVAGYVDCSRTLRKDLDGH